MEHLLARQRRPPRAIAVAVPTSWSLSPNLRHLFDDMWRMRYGMIRGIHVRDGNPLLNPPYFPIRKARLSEKAWSCRNSANADYQLTREHVRFQEELAALGTGVVDVKIVAGVPVELDLHEQP